jgi:hypothetical protein
MNRSLSRLLLAGGLTATVLVAGHNVTSGTTGALGVAAGSIVGGQLGHSAASHGATHGSSKAGPGGKRSPSSGPVSSTPGTTNGSGLTGVSTAPFVNTGLMMRGPSQPPANLDELVNGSIIEAAWNVLQPSPGTLVTTRIDKAVSAVRAWNAANPDYKRGLRLRITAGFNTPTWALNLGGPAVHLCSNSGSCGNAPRWWTAPVQAAYASYTARLAAYVNAIPEIREVTVGLTMVRFGEVMVRFPTAAGNAHAYAAAGYTEAADIVAMKAEINDGGAFNAVTQVDVADYQTPSNGQDINVSKEIMDYAVATLPHVQFANASITQTPSQNAAIFSLMQTYGARGSMTATITFQTYPTLSSVTATLARAVAFGACSVEMPQSGVSPSIAATYDAQLWANCAQQGVEVPSLPSGQSNVAIQGASLTAARLENASWNPVMWANATLTAARLDNASWNPVTWNNASWTDTNANWQNASW